jgi:hypothetical protein
LSFEDAAFGVIFLSAIPDPPPVPVGPSGPSTPEACHPGHGSTVCPVTFLA